MITHVKLSLFKSSENSCLSVENSILNTIQGRERVSDLESSNKQAEAEDKPEPEEARSETNAEGGPDEAASAPEEDDSSRSTGLIPGRLEEHVRSEEHSTTDVGSEAEEAGEESPGGSVAEHVHEGEESSEPGTAEPAGEMPSSVLVESESLVSADKEDENKPHPEGEWVLPGPGTCGVLGELSHGPVVEEEESGGGEPA